MKFLVLLVLIASFGLVILLPGCSCETEKTIDEPEEKTVSALEALGEDFKGPTEPPSSVGPSAPPPSQ